MSEVVPLPSFGEVFFDARGQERVLRVTWHEGTLVLSLWRGEMCTASFRMPFQDVERLLDTLETGFAEASGQLSGEAEQPGDQAQGEYPDYPGTGQYARPQQQAEQAQTPQTGPYPQQSAAAYEEQPGYDAAGYGGAAPYQEQAPYQEAAHYADDRTAVYPDGDPYQDDGGYQQDGYQDGGSYQGGGAYPESDPRLASVPSVGPNDVLVARGKPPAPDKLVATGPATPPPQPAAQPAPQQQYGRQADQYQSYPGRPGPGKHGGPPPQQYGGGQGGRAPQRGGGHAQPGRHGQPPMEGSTDPYGMPPLDQQGGYSSPPPAVDPADPLGLGQMTSRTARQPAPDYQPVDYQSASDYQPADYQQGYQQQPPGHYQQQADPLATQAYDTMYPTGERGRRPEDPQPRGDERGRRREW